RDGEGELIAFLGADLAGVEVRIGVEIAARHSSRDGHTLRETIAEELAAAIGNVLGLIVHVLSARAGAKGDARQECQSHTEDQLLPHILIPQVGAAVQFGTSVTTRGLVCSRNCRVFVRSNCGSAASMHRKNLSLLASAKFGALKTG